MLWRGSVLYHPLYDPELHMSNYDFFLNLCQALPLEYVIILTNKNDVVAGFICRNQYIFTLKFCQVCLDMPGLLRFHDKDENFDVLNCLSCC